MLFCKTMGSVVGMNAVCGFIAYSILDRFSEFFADKDADEELLVDVPPLPIGFPDDVIVWFHRFRLNRRADICRDYGFTLKIELNRICGDVVCLNKNYFLVSSEQTSIQISNPI